MMWHWPVTKADSSEARYNANEAISAGRPKRAIGCLAVNEANAAWHSRQSLRDARARRVCPRCPGISRYTGSPWPTKSAAMDLVSPMTAALVTP